MSPHELVQAISKASKKRFRIGKQSDAVQFLAWLLNELHKVHHLHYITSATFIHFNSLRANPAIFISYRALAEHGHAGAASSTSVFKVRMLFSSMKEMNSFMSKANEIKSY